MKFALDLDGCLADFNTSAIALGNRLFGTSVGWDDPPQWDYFKLHWTEEQQDQLWNAMEEEFWLGLNPLISKHQWQDLDRLCFKHEVYFITSRTLGSVKRYAEAWLANQGITYPTVLVAKTKGLLAWGLELDFVWDDYPEFLRNVKYYRGWKTRCYLENHEYNKDLNGDWIRVSGFADLLQKEGLV